MSTSFSTASTQLEPSLDYRVQNVGIGKRCSLRPNGLYFCAGVGDEAAASEHLSGYGNVLNRIWIGYIIIE